MAFIGMCYLIALFVITVDAYHGGITAQLSGAIGVVSSAVGLISWWVSAMSRKAEGNPQAQE